MSEVSNRFLEIQAEKAKSSRGHSGGRGYQPELPLGDELAQELLSERIMENEFTREELNARLEAADSKVELRLERFERRIVDSIHQIHTELAPLKNMKANVWGATAVIIGTVLAAFSLMISSFDSGRDTAATISAAKAELQAAAQSVSAATAQLNTAKEALSDTVKGKAEVAPPQKPAQKPEPKQKK